MKRTWKGLFPALLFLTLCSAGAAAQERAQELIARGNQHYARGEYGPAIAEYERVARVDGEAYAQALYNIGVCRFELWQTEEPFRRGRMHGSFGERGRARGRELPPPRDGRRDCRCDAVLDRRDRTASWCARGSWWPP